MDRMTEGKQKSEAAGARLPWWGIVLALLLVVGTAPVAEAQYGNSRFSRPLEQPSATPQPAPEPSVKPKELEAVREPWPRLEAGALLCKSRDDLVKYQTKIADGATATTAEQSLDCHKLRKQTGIQILDHDGPSRTQVVTTEKSKETGWTNTYLPATPPQSAKSTDAEK